MKRLWQTDQQPEDQATMSLDMLIKHVTHYTTSLNHSVNSFQQRFESVH